VVQHGISCLPSWVFSSHILLGITTHDELEQAQKNKCENKFPKDAYLKLFMSQHTYWSRRTPAQFLWSVRFSRINGMLYFDKGKIKGCGKKLIQGLYTELNSTPYTSNH